MESGAGAQTPAPRVTRALAGGLAGAGFDGPACFQPPQCSLVIHSFNAQTSEYLTRPECTVNYVHDAREP